MAARPRASDVVADLLREVRSTRPVAVGDLVVRQAARLGLADARLWLADIQRRVLVPFGHAGDPGPAGLSIDGTLAGRAYRSGQVQEAPGDGAAAVWVPLLQRADCVGVLGGMVDAGSPVPPEDLLLLGTAAAAVLTLHDASTDVILETRRLVAASLEAEVQWALLPPLCFAAERTTVCGALEPAYDIGGDSIDYAVNTPVAHLAVFDAMGHGLQATLMASATIGAYRHARRSGRSLAGTYDVIDRVVAEFGSETFVTGVLAELELDTGELRYLIAGHYPALVLRGGRVVRHLDDAARRPFGLGGLGGRPGPPDGARPGPAVDVGRESLEPGDRVVLYTDGVIEARDAGGAFFGLDGLLEVLEHAEAAALPPAETVRRLIHAVLDHQEDVLQDDATLLMAEWHPPR